MDFSIPQQKAIDIRDTNVVVSASAGSGKTAVLVERLCQLVLKDHISIDSILAMTFTKDAAAEMKARLLSKLKEQPKTEEEIKKIVENITNQYNVNISINAKDSIVNLMSHVNDLGLDYSELKSSLKEASNKLSNNLKELGIKLKEEGFFEKIKNWFVDLWDKFINLFRSNDNNEEESKENAPLDFNQEPIKEQSDDENQNLEEKIRPGHRQINRLL